MGINGDVCLKICLAFKLPSFSFLLKYKETRSKREKKKVSNKNKMNKETRHEL